MCKFLVPGEELTSSVALSPRTGHTAAFYLLKVVGCLYDKLEFYKHLGSDVS